MIAAIATEAFDLEGSILIETLPGTEAPQIARRNNRVATLDGGAVTNDFGHSYADMTLKLRWKPKDPEQDEGVARLVKLYARLVLFHPEGVFLVIPQRLTRRPEAHELTLLALRRLDV